jgi:iron complex outermembrane receptor protein
VGRTNFGQYVADLVASRDFGAALGLQSLNLAAGVQYRRDNFKVTRGDPASYAVGPLAASGKAAGSNGRPGYAPQDENNLSRRNIGAFIDAEADLTDALLLTAALRYEDYSDFGGNLSGRSRDDSSSARTSACAPATIVVSARPRWRRSATG